MSTPTLDGMTVAQLDDIIARATATKAAAVKAEEDKSWREFTPECTTYRIHAQTREVQMRGGYGWVASPSFSATMKSININRTRKRYIVSALTALGVDD